MCSKMLKKAKECGNKSMKRRVCKGGNKENG